VSPIPGGRTERIVNIEFEHPWLLVLLILAGLPFLYSSSTAVRYSWLELVPRDGMSRALGFTLRMIGAIAIASLVVALSGLQRGEQYVERVAEGAQMVIVLDRSRSMNDTFAGRAPTGGEESKAAAASRLLLSFVGRRPDNVYGVVEFTSSPIYVLPLTSKITAIQAAIKAAGDKGLALTNIASPLVMAAEYFQRRAYRGARVIVLVSDGAAKIEEEVGNWLRDAFKNFNVRLYWIYIPSEDSPGIFAKVPYDELPVAGVPEQDLHRYFKSLGIPYTAYEAQNPAALRHAVADMDRLERWPLRTMEVVPREDISGYAYALSLAMILLLIAMKLLEVRVWR
jgi:mxaC protein